MIPATIGIVMRSREKRISAITADVSRALYTYALLPVIMPQKTPRMLLTDRSDAPGFPIRYHIKGKRI